MTGLIYLLFQVLGGVLQHLVTKESKRLALIPNEQWKDVPYRWHNSSQAFECLKLSSAKVISKNIRKALF